MTAVIRDDAVPNRKNIVLVQGESCRQIPHPQTRITRTHHVLFGVQIHAGYLRLVNTPRRRRRTRTVGNLTARSRVRSFSFRPLLLIHVAMDNVKVAMATVVAPGGRLVAVAGVAAVTGPAETAAHTTHVVHALL